MKVYIERTNEVKNLKANSVSELLGKLCINPTTVLIVKNNSLVTESAKLKDSDDIKIISVISGG